MNENNQFDLDFYTALNGEDDLGAVIRTHLFIEYLLDEYLDNVFNDYKSLDLLHLEYNEKLSLASAILFKKEDSKALKAIGNLRNRFAHNLDAKLDKQTVDNLYTSLSTSDKEIVKNAHENIIERDRGDKKKAKFNDLPPKERFVYIAIAIKARLQLTIFMLEDELKFGVFVYKCQCGFRGRIPISENGIGDEPNPKKWICPSCKERFRMKICWSIVDPQNE